MRVRDEPELAVPRLEPGRGREREPDEVPAIGRAGGSSAPPPRAPGSAGSTTTVAMSAFWAPSDIERAVPISRSPSHAVANSVVPRSARSSDAGSDAPEVPAARTGADRRPGRSREAGQARPRRGRESRPTGTSRRWSSHRWSKPVRLDPAEDLRQRPRLAVAVRGLGPVVGTGRASPGARATHAREPAERVRAPARRPSARRSDRPPGSRPTSQTSDPATWRSTSSGPALAPAHRPSGAGQAVASCAAIRSARRAGPRAPSQPPDSGRTSTSSHDPR